MAAALPTPATLRGAVGLVSRTYHTALPDVWAMEMWDMLDWARRASPRRRR